MKTIKISDVDVLKGVYLDFENGPVFLLKISDDRIMLVGADDSYRGEVDSLEQLLKQHNNIKYAKTLSGETIIL